MYASCTPPAPRLPGHEQLPDALAPRLGQERRERPRAREGLELRHELRHRPDVACPVVDVPGIDVDAERARMRSRAGSASATSSAEVALSVSRLRATCLMADARRR